MTTDAAGRAIASGFAPTGSGTLQISMTAAFQGQTAAAVTIAQTTVATAAQAATVSGAAGASAGGGGGLSGTTIATVAGAVAGGALVVNQLADSPRTRSFVGNFSGPLTMTFTALPPQTGVCVRTEMHTGTLRMDLEIASDGSVKGTAEIDEMGVVTAVTCSGGPQLNASLPGRVSEMEVTGTTAALAVNRVLSGTNQGLQVTETWSFTGALNGDVITGTLTRANRVVSSGDTGTGTSSYTVTLR